MTNEPLPLVVVGGYLGSGKTTLINRLLRSPGGRRITVLVNDFGAINIDADLLESKDEDTIALTNGCVCCSIGGDLFMALGDVLDRQPRPDVLVIEASGVADPRRIADTARAEPDLRYGGIVTLVDALNHSDLSADPLIAPQVLEQVACADLLAVSKCAEISVDLRDQLQSRSAAPMICVNGFPNLPELVLSISEPKNVEASTGAHGHFTSWHFRGPVRLAREELEWKLARPPEGAYRIKGMVLGPDDEAWEVHVVGKTFDMRPIPQPVETVLVAIGPASEFTETAAAEWWKSGGGDAISTDVYRAGTHSTQPSSVNH